MGGDPFKDFGQFRKVVRERWRDVTAIVYTSWKEKFLDLYFSQGYGSFDPIFLVKHSEHFFSMWFYAYIFTFMGILASFRGRGVYRAGFLLLLGTVCYRTLVHLLTFGYYRYRPPMEPYLILFGAFGLFITSREVVRALRERKPALADR